MGNTLHARRLNHGQSEVWLADESKRCVVATNAIYSAVRTHCSKEEFDAFYSTTQAQLGTVGEVFAGGTMVEELGTEQRLRPAGLAKAKPHLIAEDFIERPWLL